MSLKYTLVILALTLACFAWSPAEAAITSAERKATLKFLEEFVDEYKDQLKYLWTGDNYCAWDGVTCDANDDVHVDLSGRGLDGDMPEPKKKEGSLIRVVSINLSNNPAISDDFEKDWKYLTNLKHIDLSYTSLKGYIPDQWREMSSLEEVHIHHTAACRNLPDWSAATMPNLRVVDMSYNNFHGSIRGDWASFSKLEKFDISGNNFCGCTPSSWQSVPLLANAAAQTPMASATCAYNSCANYKNCPKAPNMGDAQTGTGSGPSTAVTDKYTLNFLKEFIDEYKNPLKYLWTGDNYCAWDGVTCDANGDVHVDLSGRGLSGDMPEPKKKEGSLVRVVSINLSNNPGISDDFEKDWKYLTNLKHIDLSYTSLKGYIPDQWREMSSLEEVHIHHTAACRNLPDWSAATMPNLRVVDMSYNNFHGSIRGDWASFSKLEKFDISGNNFCGCTPSSWQSVPLLANAAAQTPMASATCAYNSCANYKNCPKTPNTSGPASAPPSTTTTTSRPTASTTTTTESPQVPVPPTTTTTTATPITTTTTTTSEAPAVPSYDVATYNVLMTLARSFPNQLGGWTGTDYCSWNGVACADNGEVSVRLASSGLTGALLDRVASADGATARVVSIDLSGNSGITGNFPDSWSNLKRLRELDLSYTSLGGFLQSSWNGMSSIETIRITNTRACGGLPNWAMATLRSVDLSHNANLKGAMASSWVSMVSLQSARLDGNSFCACAPSTWAARPVLQGAIDSTANAAALRSLTCGYTNRCTNLNYVCPV